MLFLDLMNLNLLNSLFYFYKNFIKKKFLTFRFLARFLVFTLVFSLNIEQDPKSCSPSKTTSIKKTAVAANTHSIPKEKTRTN